MPVENDRAKYNRILFLYTKLLNGEVVNKKKAAQIFNVAERSIQRDIEDLRCFFENQVRIGESTSDLLYSQKLGGYYLKDNCNNRLSNSEILAVCKILLESRAFTKSEMMPILDKLLNCCIPKENYKMVSGMVENEKFHYVEPHHHTQFIDRLWDIGLAIQNKQTMEIEYARLKERSFVKRIISPVGIMFSEYYFYLTAFIQNIDKEEFDNPNDVFPTIYRIDRIQSYKALKEHFSVPYKDRFEEGEFRKRVQFMYGGKLQKVKFQYSGPSVESVLDRLPTAKIIDEKDGAFTMEAEVFGKGINMWLRSQGDNIKVIDQVV